MNLMKCLIDKYSHILEPNSVDTKYHNNNEQVDVCNTSLAKSVRDFIKKHNIQNIILSLSGGVDSMVMLEIVQSIIVNLNYDSIHSNKESADNTHELKLYCCHINYNNRDESSDEASFLREYCLLRNIHYEQVNVLFKRGSIKRSDYERQTRQLRYDYYKEMIQSNNCDGVFLAHHKDDLCENIFNNIMRGTRELTDLTVLNDVSSVLGVTTYRPMLGHYKEDIYDIARSHMIPYFLDTTPDWSCRGKMRRRIFPACSDCYGNNYRQSLIKLGDESDALHSIIHLHIIDNFDKKITYSNQGGLTDIVIPIEPILLELYLLKLVIKGVCHKIGVPMMKHKNIEKMCEVLNRSSCTEIPNKQGHCQPKYSFMNGYTTTITSNVITLSNV